MKSYHSTNQLHEHKYYFSTTKKEFEPVNPDEVDGVTDLYRMVEYALLMCACTDVIKVKVHNKDEEY